VAHYKILAKQQYLRHEKTKCMQIFLIIDLRTLALLIEYDKIKLMLDKLTHTFKKHLYYFLEKFGVLKCFIAFLEEFCNPLFRKCHSRQCSMANREILGQHWSI